MFILVLMLESNLFLMLMLMLIVDAESIFGSLLLSHGSYCRFVSCLCKSVFFVLYSKSLVLVLVVKRYLLPAPTIVVYMFDLY